MKFIRIKTNGEITEEYCENIEKLYSTIDEYGEDYLTVNNVRVLVISQFNASELNIVGTDLLNLGKDIYGDLLIFKLVFSYNVMVDSLSIEELFKCDK